MGPVGLQARRGPDNRLAGCKTWLYILGGTVPQAVSEDTLQKEYTKI